ncbi:MAG: hypothetical protein ABSC23_03000 [Bryobacteraceae bacterium]|jgi:hypothetical protein
MPVPVAIIIAIAAVFLAIVLGRQASAWWQYRGERVITCPENQQPAGVTVDVRHAAASAAMGAPELRLSACSRWPEKAGCGQPCLSQIAAAPEDCLVRNILTRWYEGKVCASCGRPFGALEWEVAKPALMPSSGVSVEWRQVPAEKLQETLATARPVCFACHMASTMVREHPDLVVERPAPRPS